MATSKLHKSPSTSCYKEMEIGRWINVFILSCLCICACVNVCREKSFAEIQFCGFESDILFSRGFIFAVEDMIFSLIYFPFSK